MGTMDFENRPPWNFRNRKTIPFTSLSLLFLPCSYHFPALWHTFGWNAQSFLNINSWTLTDTWPLIITSSEKRTLTGLDFNLAFFAALIKADLGDWKGKWWQNISHTFKLKPIFFIFSHFWYIWNSMHTATLCRLFTEEWKCSWTVMLLEIIHMYIHTRSPWYTSCSESYPTVRLERWEGLSVHIQIPCSALMMIAVNQTNFLLWPDFNLLHWNHLRSKCSALGKKNLSAWRSLTNNWASRAIFCIFTVKRIFVFSNRIKAVLFSGQLWIQAFWHCPTPLPS